MLERKNNHLTDYTKTQNIYTTKVSINKVYTLQSIVLSEYTNEVKSKIIDKVTLLLPHSVFESMTMFTSGIVLLTIVFKLLALTVTSGTPITSIFH